MALVVLAAGCGRQGGQRTAPDSPERIEVVVEAPDGSTCTLCAWLADSASERQHGLMGVDELTDVDGMVFRYDADTVGPFWMRHTLIPLDIAFYDASGRYVGGASMTPCPDDVSDAACPRHGADAPYRVAIEVAGGRAGELGLVPGSRVSVTGPCAGPTRSEDPSSASGDPHGATLSP